MRHQRRNRHTVVSGLFLATALAASTSSPGLGSDGASAATPLEVQFVTGDAARLPAGDVPVVDELRALGAEVVLADDDSVAVPAPGTTDVIVISTSVVPAKVFGLFSETPIPLLTWEPYLFTDLGMTGDRFNDRGETPSSSTVSIVDAVHPLAAGLSGRPSVTTAPQPLTYGAPAPGASIIATDGGNPGRTVLFAYEAGTAMHSGVAPARRVGTHLSYQAPRSWTESGRTLLRATIEWLTAIEVAPTNQAPIVDAGSDHAIEVGATILLDGVVSDDGLPLAPGHTVSTWQVDGPGPVLVADPAALSTTARFTQAGQYQVTLEAHDGELTTAATVGVSVTEADDDHSVLFVAGNAQPPSAERSLVERLTARGIRVEVVDDDLVQASQAAGHDAVIVASSVVPGTVADRFAASPVPVVTWEPYLYDEFGLGTGTETGPQTKVRIDEPEHPLAAGLTGTVAVVSTPRPLSVVTPAGDATIVASVGGVPAVVAWEAGAALADTTALPSGKAPARRVTLFATYQASSNLTVAGWALFDASISWAMGNAAPPNTGPIVDAGPDRLVEPGTVVLFGTVTDDGLPDPPGVIDITWTMDGGPGATITSPSTAETGVELTTAGTYVFTLTASDGALESSDSTVVTVTPFVNLAPVVDAGGATPIAASVGDLVPLAGTVVDDGLPSPPGVTTVEWSATGPGNVTFTDRHDPLTTVSFDDAGTYTLVLSAFDGLQASNDVLTVVVAPAPSNRAPVVRAGADVTTVVDVPVALSGSVTDDGLPAPPTLEILWVASGPGTVTFGDPTTPATTATFSAPGDYVLSLSAQDGELAERDTVMATVAPSDEGAVPIAVISASRTQGGPPLVVEFDGQDSAGVAGGPLRYRWDFDDGSISEERAPRHIFTQPGRHTIELVVTDEQGRTGRTELDVTVAEYRERARVLIVAGSAPVPSPERPIVDHLLARGHGITVVDDDAVTAAHADDHDIVLILSSIVPDTVGELFADTPLPVVVSEPYLFDDMGLATGPGSAGESSPTSQLTILDPEHPLAAGLSGSPTILNQPQPLSWGAPVPGAHVVAVTPDVARRAVVFAFDTGDETARGPAPARRVGWYASYRTPTLFNPTSWAMLDEALDWAFTADNLAPDVDAGADEVITDGHSASLFAVVADDGLPTGRRLITQWSGPAGVSFGDPRVVSTSASFAGPGTYTLSLTASDGQRATIDTVVVTVEPAGSPSANFVVDERNGTIFDPDGNPFLPIGVNMVLGSYTGPWWTQRDGVQFSQPSIEALKANWGVNIVRLNLCDLPTEKCFAVRNPFEDPVVLAQIDLLTANGIVAWIDNHTIYPGNSPTPHDIAEARENLMGLAHRYRDNPYVWFEPFNEPGRNADTDNNGVGDDVELADPANWQSTAWWSWHQPVLDGIRSTGNDNVVILSGAGWGQDKLYRTGGFSVHESAVLSFAQPIAAAYDNIAYDIHLYDRWATPDTDQIGRFFTEAHSRGAAVLLGETGWTTDDTSTTPEGPVWHARAEASATAFYTAGYPGVGATAFHGRSVSYGFPDVRQMTSRPNQPQAALLWDWAHASVAPCTDGTFTCSPPA